MYYNHSHCMLDGKVHKTKINEPQISYISFCLDPCTAWGVFLELWRKDHIWKIQPSHPFIQHLHYRAPVTSSFSWELQRVRAVTFFKLCFNKKNVCISCDSLTLQSHTVSIELPIKRNIIAQWVCGPISD